MTATEPLAPSSRAPSPTDLTPESSETTGGALPRATVLKQGSMFFVADDRGDVLGGADGLFDDDTRLLSRFRLTFGGTSPALLQSGVSPDNAVFAAHVTNGCLSPVGGTTLPRDVIYLVRRHLLWADRLYGSLELTNYGHDDALVPLRLDFAADFHDMFEVRGEKRPARGRVAAPAVGPARVDFRYEGLDGRVKTSSIAFSATPAALTDAVAAFELALPARQSMTLYVEVGQGTADMAAAAPSAERFREASIRARADMRRKRGRGASLKSSDGRFNNWLDQSRNDLALLTTDLPTGPYPYAGIPWFSTPFGRDGIITALQMLWLDPSLARGVLAFLASTQAHETSAFRASTPGKIMHETRKGEMALLEELPFGRYYGGVDTTPLFIMLASAYADRTGDLAFIDELWPALRLATAWMEEYGDSNGDGFLDYPNDQGTGLTNQNWKDSVDSVFYADGSFPVGPIAPVEVQGYAFAAYRGMAELAARRGDERDAQRWRVKAEDLRKAVEKQFWMTDDAFYALALDGRGRPCNVRGSNPAHLLFTGLPTAERAAAVARTLMSEAFDTGWGIRTLATGAARYNPMSYHNGSVWPHDTAIAAAGLSRYGERDDSLRLLAELFDAAREFDMRLPELYCGFPRRINQPPVAYPVACLPQAWAAGSVFMVLQAALGLSINGWRSEIVIEHPSLPPSLDWLRLKRIPVGSHIIDLSFKRIDGHVAVITDGVDHRVPVIVHG